MVQNAGSQFGRLAISAAKNVAKGLHNPDTRYVYGAGLGAAGGGLAGFLLEQLRERHERRRGLGVASGAAAGAAIGSLGLRSVDSLAPMGGLRAAVSMRPQQAKQAGLGESFESAKGVASQGVDRLYGLLGQAAEKVKTGLANPKSRALYGAGLGAAAGGAAGIAAEAAGGKKRKRKSYVGSALTGAAGGAALGAGAGYISSQAGPDAWAAPPTVGGPEYEKFVASLPADPAQRAAALKEYINRPDTQSPLAWAAGHGVDAATAHPVASTLGAAGAATAMGAKAYDTSQSLQPEPEGAKKTWKNFTGWQMGNAHRLEEDFNMSLNSAAKDLDPTGADFLRKTPDARTGFVPRSDVDFATAIRDAAKKLDPANADMLLKTPDAVSGYTPKSGIEFDTAFRDALKKIDPTGFDMARPGIHSSRADLVLRNPKLVALIQAGRMDHPDVLKALGNPDPRRLSMLRDMLTQAPASQTAIDRLLNNPKLVELVKAGQLDDPAVLSALGNPGADRMSEFKKMLGEAIPERTSIERILADQDLVAKIKAGRVDDPAIKAVLAGIDPRRRADFLAKLNEAGRVKAVVNPHIKPGLFKGFGRAAGLAGGVATVGSVINALRGE